MKVCHERAALWTRQVVRTIKSSLWIWHSFSGSRDSLPSSQKLTSCPVSLPTPKNPICVLPPSFFYALAFQVVSSCVPTKTSHAYLNSRVHAISVYPFRFCSLTVIGCRSVDFPSSETISDMVSGWYGLSERPSFVVSGANFPSV